MEKVQIKIFQAPFASLMEHGLYLKMHDVKHRFQGTVPAEYYLLVFNGSINCPVNLSADPNVRDYELLEYAFRVFNLQHPDGYCGRSMSVGDVVCIDDRYYLCAVVGFTPVTFTTSAERLPMETKNQCLELLMPDGIRLQVTAHQKSDYPCINIDLISGSGARQRVCFAEYNPEREHGRELCIGVYRSDSDETVYYGSYCTDKESEA